MMSVNNNFNKMYWTDEMEDTLIKLVHKHPCMWDSSHPDYKNRLSRQKCLDEAVRQLDFKFDDKSIKRKWKIIRDYYYKETKKLETFGGDELIYKSRWIHTDKLTFLKKPIYVTESSDAIHIEFQDSISDRRIKTETPYQYRILSVAYIYDSSSLIRTMNKIFTRYDRKTFTYKKFHFKFDKGSRVDKECEFWKCKIHDCYARLHIKAGVVVKEINIHCHQAPDTLLKVERFINEDDSLLEAEYTISVQDNQPATNQQMPMITSTCITPSRSTMQPSDYSSCSSQSNETTNALSQLKRVSPMSESDDEDELFCKYVSKRMRKLNDEQKDELKWMITNYFYDVNRLKP